MSTPPPPAVAASGAGAATPAASFSAGSSPDDPLTALAALEQLAANSRCAFGRSPPSAPSTDQAEASDSAEERAAADGLEAELSELAEASAMEAPTEPTPRAEPATASGSRSRDSTWGGWLRSKLAAPSHDAATDGGRFGTTVCQTASLRPKDDQQQQRRQAAARIQAVQRGRSTRTAMRHAPPAAEDVASSNPCGASPALGMRGSSPGAECGGSGSGNGSTPPSSATTTPPSSAGEEAKPGSSGWRRSRIFSMLQPVRPATTGATVAVAATGRVSPLPARLSPGVGSSSARGQTKADDMEAVLKAQRAKAKADADARRAELLAGGPGRSRGSPPCGAASGSRGAASSAATGAAGACGEAMDALRERGEKLENLHAGTAKMSDEAESLFEAARKIREKTEHNSRWLPF